MRNHMTQGEMIRVQKCLRNGITDVFEIQKHVFVHADKIQQVIDKHNKANAPAEEASAKPPKKKAARRRRVDPLS